MKPTRPRSLSPAELLTHKLDRRYRYAWIDGVLHKRTFRTGPCPDCLPPGAGCNECGHTTRRRVSGWVLHPVPADSSQA